MNNIWKLKKNAPVMILSYPRSGSNYLHYCINELVGVDLMRKAFNPDNGELTDMSCIKAEREATSHLFAGAIGLFKNPSSHRDVNWQDPGECVELIYLANHLLRLVEKHSVTARSSSNLSQ